MASSGSEPNIGASSCRSSRGGRSSQISSQDHTAQSMTIRRQGVMMTLCDALDKLEHTL